MKRPLYHIIRLALVILPVMLTVATAIAQDVVYMGETTELRVTQKGYDTYRWDLYNDPAVDFASEPGNAPANEAFFVEDNNEGTTVRIMWLKPGTYFYRVLATDKTGCTNNVKIGMIQVIQSNKTPIANDDVYITIMNLPRTLPVLQNDSDPNSFLDPASLAVTTMPVHGTLSINSKHEFVYTPEPDFIGQDEFIYRVCDDGAPYGVLCDEAKVTISVEPPNVSPVAVVDFFSESCYNIFNNLLLNDYDPNNNQLIINTTPVIEPVNGTLTIFEDGTFRYEFERGSFRDSFVYELCDDHLQPLCSEALVYINIFADNDCDGISDEIDIDDDNDGIVDWTEGEGDNDGDGVPNSQDIDSDGDGIPDIIEAQAENQYIRPSGIDANHNGLDDAYETGGQTGLNPVDTDQDKLPDYLDADSDNDGVPDYIEGYDMGAKGIAQIMPGISDIDNDGLDDAYDNFLGGYNDNDLDNPFGTNPHIQDFDGDGTSDWRDTDDDGDGIATKYEDLNNNGIYYDDDTDFDGHPEYLDLQGPCTMFIPEGFSPNGDGIHDYFQIYCIDQYPDARLMIFDRWGRKLYEHEQYGNLSFWGSYEKSWWDGSQSNGERLAPGNYLYVLVRGDGNTDKGAVMLSY